MAPVDDGAADPIGAAEANYLAAWMMLAEGVDGGVVDERDDVVFTSVPAPVAYFNCAFVKPPADPVACITTVKAFFARRNTPFTLRFREEISPEAHTACESAGLVPAGHSPLMLAAVGDIAPPVSVDIRPVRAESWHDHISTIAAGFGMPLDLLTGLLAPGLVDDDCYAGVNAYVDGEVASTATLIVSDGVAGVYNVATRDGFRRRGLGEATTRAVVVEGARRGCGLTTLQASDMGYPIYHRMGYRTVVQWRSFTGP